MTNIDILIPVHVTNDTVNDYLDRAIESVVNAQKHYEHGKLNITVVCPSSVTNGIKEVLSKWENMVQISCFINNGNTDFCSQVNAAVLSDNFMGSEYFSILEFDDEYAPKWFKMAHDYYYGNEDVSIFLPVNACIDPTGAWQFGNEMVLATSFSNNIGFIDFDCLENCSTFNLTGAIFNTNDFRQMGGYKPSIKVAFNYELLLRMTSKDLKAYVVPKEGYYHRIGRPDSLIDEYSKTLTDEEISKYFDLAKREYTYKEDRNKSISQAAPEELK